MLKRYQTIFGEEVTLAEEKLEHVLVRHPEVITYIEKIKEVLKLPEIVKLSRRNPNVHLYYKFYEEVYGGKYLLVVVNNRTKVISTVFITDKIKVGEMVWPKK